MSALSTIPEGSSNAGGAKRRLLLHAAARIVAEEGVEALSIRRVAAAVGASTMAVYTWYGSKPNLLRALYREAFVRFGQALRSSQGGGEDDPLAGLVRLGEAYRDFALCEPNLYEVMFGRSSRFFQPQPADSEVAFGTFAVLVGAVERAVAAGLLACEPSQGAWQLWAAVHGAVSLELRHGHCGPPPAGGAGEDYTRLGRSVLVGLGAPEQLVDAAIAGVKGRPEGGARC